MKPSDDREAAAVFDFIDEYLSDLDAGRALPLAHYLARFKGHEEAIAREFLTLRGEERVAATSAHAAPETDERRIGPYRLLRELGRGGQGSVWLAEDVRIARKVALKVLASRFETVSEDRRRRFRREAEVIARLEHPSICPIYDADVDCDTPWIAMRLVEGKTLAQLLGEARAEREEDTEAAERRAAEAARHDSQESEVTTSWPPRSTLDVHRTLLLFERCARALHAAHEAGVVHRDVKPGNLIVTPDGKPVILDFGLARDEASDVGSITESGEVFGTPAYMSPEQLGGPSEDLDRRTDVYSLGVALYESLTLKRPFDKGGNKAALYTAIQNEAAEDPRALNDALSLDVQVVLETAMEKDRARRYATALDFAEDLRRIREYEPIKARPASVPLKLARWIRKHPALATSLIGTIVVLAVGLTVALVLNVRLQDAIAKKDDALDVALGNHLAQRARTLTREDPSAALALGLHAVQKAPSDLTREALVEALEACRLKSVLAPEKPVRQRDLSLSPSGELLAVACETGTIELFDATTCAPLRALAVAASPAIALAWFPDDRTLIAGHADGRIVLWDARAGRASGERVVEFAPAKLDVDPRGTCLLAVGPGAAGRMRCECLDVPSLTPRFADPGARPHDGARFLATGAEVIAWSLAEGRVDVLSASDARTVRSWEAGSPITAVDFEATTRRLAVASRDHGVRVLDSALTEQGAVALDSEFEVDWLRLGGEHVLVSTRRRSNRSERDTLLARLSDGTVRSLTKATNAAYTTAAFTHDGSRLALADAENGLHIIEPSTSAHDRFLTSSFLTTVQVVWSRDSRTVFTRSSGPAGFAWYADGAAGAQRHAGRTGNVVRARISPDGEELMLASSDGVVHHGRIELERILLDPEPILTVQNGARHVPFFGFDARGRAWWTGATGVVNPTTKGTVYALSSPEASILESVCSSDGESLAVVDSRGRVGVLSAKEPHGRWLEESPASSPPTTLAFDDAGHRLAVGRADGCTDVVDVASMRVLRVLEDPRSKVEAADAAFRPGSDELAVFGRDNRVRLWDVRTGARLLDEDDEKQKKLNAFEPRSVAYSSDGALLLVTGRVGGGAVRVFEREPLRQVTFDTYHRSTLTAGEFSPDTRFVLTASRDGTVFVRESRTGKLFARRAFEGLEVLDARFGGPADALRILAVTSDGAAHVWPVDPLPVATKRFVRELDSGEKKREKKLAEPLEYR
ncbi:MAG: protein kinase [Planctomycetes bacterium]|nr:protein kinase [Planctomycetota bacterium]